MATVTSSSFGSIQKDGKDVDITEFELRNQHGLSVRIIDYGATIISILAPDRDGLSEEIVLNHTTIEELSKNEFYFG